MKKLLYFVLSVFILCACSDETEINSPTMPSLKAGGDGKYDVLGYGYDITGNYLHYTSVKARVIDMTIFSILNPERIEISQTTHTYFTNESGENAKRYIEELTYDFKKSGGINPSDGNEDLFTETFTNDKTGTIKRLTDYSSQYSFASVDMVVVSKYIYLNADIKLLFGYASRTFTTDLSRYSVDEIIEKYGTHVLTNITIGGKLSATYRSTVTSSTKKTDVKKGLDYHMGKIFGFSSNQNISETEILTNKEKYLWYRTSGGTGSLVGEIDLENGIQKINIGNWSESVNATNASLVDVNWRYAIPIYEFVPNAAKKEELKAAVIRYIKSKKLEMVSPIYRWWESGKNISYCTTLENDRNTWGNNWSRDEGNVGHIFKEQRPGTVPVYRWWESAKFISYLTIVENDKNTSGNNWSCDGIIGYAYKTQQRGTVPVYRWWHSKKYISYCTILQNDKNTGDRNWSCDGIIFYVYP